MLKKLTINNFQSHQRTTLEFSPGVNVIVGTTDSGKSAILRALRWLIWNKPNGDSFRSWWGGDIKVSLETEEDSIYRKKGKTDEYVLNEGSPFRAFRTDVPKEIVDAINISEINFQQQADRYFLLNNTSGEVARFFNKVAHLDQIDKGSSFIRSVLSSLSSDLKRLKIDRKKKREELDKYEYLEKFEMEVEALEQLQSEKEFTAKSKAKLKELIDSCAIIEEEIATNEEVIALEEQVDHILDLYKTKREIKVQIDTIEDLLASLLSIERRKKKYQNLIDLEDTINTVLDLFKEKKEVEKDTKILQSNINSLNALTRQIKESTFLISNLEEKFNNNFPDICPLCETPIKHKK